MKSYRPVTVYNLPVDFAFEASGRLRANMEHYVRAGVVRVIAGPEKCHVVVDVRRPYTRPPMPLPAPFMEART